MSQSGTYIATWEDEQLFNLTNTGNPDDFNRARTYNSNVRFATRTAPNFEEAKEEEAYLGQTVYQPSYNYTVKNQGLEANWPGIAQNVMVAGGLMLLVGGVASLVD